MNRTKLFIFLCMSYYSAFCQSPSILWQKTFGGTLNEEGHSMLIEQNGDIIIGAFSESIDGDIQNNIRFFDFWIIRLDVNGNSIWSYNYGGTLSDMANSIIKTFDNGYIICGQTNSDTINRYHAALGEYDVLITKIDSNGNLEWQNCYGGYYKDEGRVIKKTLDSGYVFITEINNGGGDITGFHGQVDYWVTKINSTGVIQWNRCLGGTYIDTPKSLTVLSDGNILVTGVNGSSDGTVTCGAVGYSAWVVKLDENGNILWDKCYGGSSPEIGYDITESENGGFYVCASTNSNDGDVLGHIAGKDIWIFKADSSGSILWSNCFGGLGDENPESISKTSDGGVIVTGGTTSNPGHPSYDDVIVVKVDSLGSLQWQIYLGGNNMDYGYDAAETPDHNFVVTGFTQSIDGDITFNHGQKDVWVVKLEAPVSVQESIEINLFSYKISESKLELIFDSGKSGKMEINLLDLAGRQLLTSNQNYSSGKNEIEIPVNVVGGIYIVQLKTTQGAKSFKVFCN